MDTKTAFLIAILVISSTAGKSSVFNPEHDEEELPSRPEAMESVVRQLLVRVEQLETRDKAQQELIENHLVRIKHLETREDAQQQIIHTLLGQLQVQRQRSSSLERIVKRINKAVSESADSGKEASSQEDTHNEESSITSKKPSRLRRAADDETIAFFATLSSHLEHAGVLQTFVFDRVVTNFGSGYNNHNGNFIAPVSGTYVFSATLISLYHQSSHSQFTKNGQPISYMYVSGAEAGYDTTSQTIVIYMQKGDDICIQNIDANKSYHGDHYSTFSGFLLQQNNSESIVVGKK